VAQCTAKSKRSGERCKNFCSPGRTTCRFHGGRTPRGFGLPQTRHGHYSKFLPPRLLTNYKKSLANPRRVEPRDSIALVDARLAQLFQELALVDEEDRMDKASVQYQRIKKALTNGDQANLRSAMIELDRLIRFGRREYQLWKEIMATLNRRGKFVLSKLKWEILSGQMIPKDQAIILFEAAGEIIKENITDPKILAEICEELGGLIEPTSVNVWAENRPIDYVEILINFIQSPKRS
jgi:hypothetical protein